jgi:class 3 adenylate cyclase
MEPRIQYAKTEDGVRIAHTTVGHGPPLVVCGDLADAHVQLMWEQSPSGPFYRQLAERYTIVKFDHRGLGLSDRDVADFSLDALLLDAEAVVNQLGMSGCHLLGTGIGVPTAIAYAARHPERVSSLCLVGASVRTADILARHRAMQLASLITTDWELFLENLAAVNFGFGKEESTRTARFLAAACDPDTFVRGMEFVSTWDATELLPLVRCPTLIVHYSGVHFQTMEMARELAAGISDSRLVVLDYPWALRDDEVVETIFDFLAEEAAPGEAKEAAQLPQGMTAILFADIVDSTALTERMGDTAFRDKARELDGTLRTIIGENAGTVIEGKLLGDGVLATFTSARQAIEAALRCGEAGESTALPLHLGLHAGDVIREEGNVYGGAVNIAARIADASAPGELLVSQTVRDLARTSAGVSFEDRGERELKGVGEPVRMWAVREQG